METQTLSWQDCGRISLNDGALVLPDVTSSPGLYRLTFASGAIYVGEAGDIRRRLGDYLIYYPATGIETEHRINKRLCEERGAKLEIILDERFSLKSARCQREHEEIRSAKQTLQRTGKPAELLLNGGSLEDRIAFHEKEISRLKARLQV